MSTPASKKRDIQDEEPTKEEEAAPSGSLDGNSTTHDHHEAKRQRQQEQQQQQDPVQQQQQRHHDNNEAVAAQVPVPTQQAPASGQSSPRQSRHQWLSFTGTRHTRVGTDYQVASLPNPTPFSSDNGNKHD